MKRLFYNLLRNPFIITFLLSPFFLFLLYAYYQKIYAYGCFDDCFNFMGGYFLLKGKIIFSEFFFNHQMGMAYVSFLIQKLLHPDSIFHLVLYHRLALLGFVLLFNAFLIYRFRFIGLGFVVVYEATKYYIFGDRFLAEAFIVYPLVYMLGVVWELLRQKERSRKEDDVPRKFVGLISTIKSWEVVFVGVYAWFVIFMREPYVPVALFLYGLVLFLSHSRKKLLSLGIFIALNLLIVITVPLKDYFFNVITINSKLHVTKMDFSPSGILQMVFYPVFVFFSGESTFFRQILMSLSAIFLFSVAFLLWKKQTVVRGIGILFLTLGLANLRIVTPGSMFFEAFHMLPWYSLFVFALFLLLFDVFHIKKSVGFLLIGILTSALLFFSFSKQSFLLEKVDRHAEYVTNYSNYYVPGEVVRLLSTSQSTLFLDGWDDLIYFQADRLSPYKYTWYTSFMPYFAVYTDARNEMFRVNPPDFYYGDCPNVHLKAYVIPQERKNEYVQFYFSGKPTCLHMKSELATRITDQQREKMKDFGYYLSNWE